METWDLREGGRGIGEGGNERRRKGEALEGEWGTREG